MSEIGSWISALMWGFLGYAVLVSLLYIIVDIVSVRHVRRYTEVRRAEPRPYFVRGDEPPISILVPAYNEQEGIIASVQSLLQLHYVNFEVIVINDGSRDETLKRLIEAFALVPFPESYPQPLKTQPVRGVYISADHPQLRVIDKVNGGKSDALNAGINLSSFPLYCGVDADSILDRDSLLEIVQPFVEDDQCVASGGVIRLVNGCTVRDGNIIERRLPAHPLALFQAVEYLRGILLARVGWAAINGLLVISGAFGLFRKQAVIDVGGYAVNTIGEDMELTVRMHRLLRERGVPFRVNFVPDPVCWTEAPESLKVLRSQRVRWHMGLTESLWLNRSLMLKRGSGASGWLAFPFWLLVEWLAPAVEFLGYVLLVISFLLGYVDGDMLILLTLVTLNLGMLLSMIAIVADAMMFQVVASPRDLLVLFGVAFFENVGYRQLTVWWRVVAIFRWLTGRGATWGNMVRKANWQQKPGS